MKSLLIAISAAAVLPAAVIGADVSTAQPATATPAAVTPAVSNDREAKMSLAEARAKIGEVIANPKKVSELMQSLTKADALLLLADINAAISKLPGSLEEKTAKFLAVNFYALTGTDSDEFKQILGVTFATVAPEALTVISERYAVDLYDRDSEVQKVSEAEFAKMAKETMAVINARTAETDNGSARSSFAILMFARCNKCSPELKDELINTLDFADAREQAKNEWIPAALGTKTEDGKIENVNYEPLLAAADAGRRPDRDFVLVILGPQFGDSVTADIFGKNNDPLSFMSTRTPMLDAVENPLQRTRPYIGGNLPGGSDNPRPQDIDPGKPTPGDPDPFNPEPGPYDGQTTGGQGSGN